MRKVNDKGKYNLRIIGLCHRTGLYYMPWHRQTSPMGYIPFNVGFRLARKG